MNELKIFKNEEFGEVRTTEINGKTYFVANDVAKALGYSNPSKATNDHCKKAEMVWGNDSLGRKTAFKVIPEGDIYRLVIKSQLPSADKFERWIFDEVLPSIRQNGGYIMNQNELTPEQIVANALVVAQNILAQKDKQIAEMKPLVDFAEKVTNSADTIDMAEMAKLAHDEGIDIGRNRLIKWLKENKILMNENTPYQRYIESGYFKVVEVTKNTVFGTQIHPKTVITGKGQVWLMNKLLKEY